MNPFTFFRILLLVSLGLAATTTTTSSSASSSSSSSSTSVAPTTVWVTITTNGVLATVQSIWVQSFMSTYSGAAASVPSGTVGMGSISESMGSVRTYSRTTVSSGGSALYSTFLGMVALILGWIL